MTDLRPIVVQCIACGYTAPVSMMDEGSDEDGVYWACVNRMDCLTRVRKVLANAEARAELSKLEVRVAELERQVYLLRRSANPRFN